MRDGKTKVFFALIKTKENTKSWQFKLRIFYNEKMRDEKTKQKVSNVYKLLRRYKAKLSLLLKLYIPRQTISATDQERVEMVLFPVVNEAGRVIEEGIVVRASDLDIASVLAMSFDSLQIGTHPY
ncbi:hypothetical protein CTI12_AA210300 [Artemisia annua]|uniref:Uncharacterized protein n=1 Tax=Artemisia annua TaxID=35608 RepID=A0A2U1NR37_ARTAN|nr:hypothetical protein CTI12_AA210300 [Artemisia annua]